MVTTAKELSELQVGSRVFKHGDTATYKYGYAKEPSEGTILRITEKVVMVQSNRGFKHRVSIRDFVNANS